MTYCTLKDQYKNMNKRESLPKEGSLKKESSMKKYDRIGRQLFNLLS